MCEADEIEYKERIVLFLGVLLVVLAWPALAWAQDPAEPPQTKSGQEDAADPSDSPRRLRVYLDCDCFESYLRDEIDFVDFTRQPEDADVQLLSTTSDTAGGGREVVLRFVGRRSYSGDDRQHRVVSVAGETEATRRALVLQSVSVALLDYAMRDGRPPGVDVVVTSVPHAGRPAVASDPWRQWVFSVEGNGALDSDERSREQNWRFETGADRITDRWKITLSARIEENVEHFVLDDGGRLDVSRRERRLSAFAARSLGPHWSAGARARVEESSFDNQALSISFAPAVEFNVFPYDEYATRQLRVQYNAGFDRVRYDEATIFGKLREELWEQEISTTLDQRQSWGTIRARVEFSQYLHDLARYRIEGSGEVSLRLARGLSFNVEGSASRIRDQLSLPRRDATAEEVLLRLRQLGSGYQAELSFGLTYTFGSLLNNVVNPRFGQ
jgi:hypothetical protein